MSSPVGHSLVGCFIGLRSGRQHLPDVKTLIFCIFVANAPDLDFVPGLLVGAPNLYHHGISHSLGAAALFALLLGSILKPPGVKSYVGGFLLCFTLYSSHLLLDYISLDGRPPIGIPVFWPLSNSYFIFPYPLLPPVMHADTAYASIGQFLSDVLSFHNLYVVFLEIAVTIPIILTLWLPNFRKRGKA